MQDEEYHQSFGFLSASLLQADAELREIARTRFLLGHGGFTSSPLAFVLLRIGQWIPPFPRKGHAFIEACRKQNRFHAFEMEAA